MAAFVGWNFSLFAVALAVACKTRKASLRGTALSCAVLNVKEYSFGAPCFLTLVNYIDPNGSANFVYTLITVAVVCVVTFGATWILGWDESDFD
ncbi:MAG: hypothetical protein HFI38_10405 [Lachnospiraceae bacterium]|jgi:phosphotransferase system  glucose/maltose/N-acetylglucosamine-specific IIC component|nr:hypothetical protein [Lachnospiraceae bacterium]